MIGQAEVMISHGSIFGYGDTVGPLTMALMDDTGWYISNSAHEVKASLFLCMCR